MRNNFSTFLSVAAFASVATVAATLIPSMANAATTPDTTRAFCTQLQTSQTAISGIPATAKNRFSLISAEWTKMARFAPATIKTDVNSIAAAYKKANGETAALQKATLAGIAKAAQNVTGFTTKSCAAPGENDGSGGGRFAELASCVTKKGGTLPDRQGGGRGAGGGGGGFGELDAATQKAVDACRTELGLGAGPGGGGRGGFRNNPELTACLKKKGVTLPSSPAGEPGQPGAPRQIDAKTQTALEACRKELGLPAPGLRNANGAATSTTRKG